MRLVRAADLCDGGNDISEHPGAAVALASGYLVDHWSDQANDRLVTPADQRTQQLRNGMDLVAETPPGDGSPARREAEGRCGTRLRAASCWSQTASSRGRLPRGDDCGSCTSGKQRYRADQDTFRRQDREPAAVHRISCGETQRSGDASVISRARVRWTWLYSGTTSAETGKERSRNSATG